MGNCEGGHFFFFQGFLSIEGKYHGMNCTQILIKNHNKSSEMVKIIEGNCKHNQWRNLVTEHVYALDEMIYDDS